LPLALASGEQVVTVSGFSHIHLAKASFLFSQAIYPLAKAGGNLVLERNLARSQSTCARSIRAN
jgi:hypothetical protein